MEEANRELAGQLKDGLWDGQNDQVIATLKSRSRRLVSPQKSDGPDHPGRVPANNLGYFQAHRHHMDYPAHRRKGWPIGLGLAESAVKQFNKRVKGTSGSGVFQVRSRSCRYGPRVSRRTVAGKPTGTPDRPTKEPPKVSRTSSPRGVPQALDANGGMR